MDRSKKLPHAKSLSGQTLNGIIEDLDSMSEALADMSGPPSKPDFDEIEFRLDALVTRFLKAGLLPKKKMPRLNFHLVIGALNIPLPDRESLVQQVRTFEDLTSGYADEPSREEIDEATAIWETLTMALKKAFRLETDKNQLPLLEGQ